MHGVMVGLERRCGRPEERQGIFELCAHDGYIAAVVARRFFLLVAGFLLFVDDHESEIVERSENRRTSAHHYARPAIAHAPPFLGALDVAQSGMKHRDTFESGAKPGAALAANP